MRSVLLHRAKPVYANVANRQSIVALLAMSSWTLPSGRVSRRSDACTTNRGVTHVRSRVKTTTFG